MKSSINNQLKPLQDYAPKKEVGETTQESKGDLSLYVCSVYKAMVTENILGSVIRDSVPVWLVTSWNEAYVYLPIYL